MPLAIERIPFGLSDIRIGEGADEVNFDGVDELQAEGGEITITPEFEDVTIADYGTSPFDKRIVGYTVQVTISAAQESMRVLQLALAATETITDATSGNVVGLTDSPIGTSMRKKGKKVSIHPRQHEASFKELDITIYKMISDGDFTRTTGNTQGNVSITLSMLPRDGMNPKKPGNFFYIGGTDPNKAAA